MSSYQEPDDVNDNDFSEVANIMYSDDSVVSKKQEKKIKKYENDTAEETENLIKNALMKQQGKHKRPLFTRKYNEFTTIKILVIIYIFCPLIFQVLLRGWVIFLYIRAASYKPNVGVNFFDWVFFFLFCFVIIFAVVFAVVSILIDEAQKLFTLLSAILSTMFSICAIVEAIIVCCLPLPENEKFFIAVVVVASIASLAGFIIPPLYAFLVFRRDLQKKKKKKNLFE